MVQRILGLGPSVPSRVTGGGTQREITQMHPGKWTNAWLSGGGCSGRAWPWSQGVWPVQSGVGGFQKPVTACQIAQPLWSGHSGPPEMKQNYTPSAIISGCTPTGSESGDTNRCSYPCVHGCIIHSSPR